MQFLHGAWKGTLQSGLRVCPERRPGSRALRMQRQEHPELRRSLSPLLQSISGGGCSTHSPCVQSPGLNSPALGGAAEQAPEPLPAASIPTPPENWNSLFSPWPTKPVSLLLWQYNCAHRDTSRKAGSLPLKSQLQSGKFPNDNFSSKIVSQPAQLCLPKADIPACFYRWELDKDWLKSVLSGMACGLWPNPQQTQASRLGDLTARQELGIKCQLCKIRHEH